MSSQCFFHIPNSKCHTAMIETIDIIIPCHMISMWKITLSGCDVNVINSLRVQVKWLQTSWESPPKLELSPLVHFLPLSRFLFSLFLYWQPAPLKLSIYEHIFKALAWANFPPRSIIFLFFFNIPVSCKWFCIFFSLRLTDSKWF